MDITTFSLETLENMLTTDYLQGLGAIITVPIILYILECFLGYRIFRIKCAVLGFSAGFSIGLIIANLIPLTVAWQIWLCGGVLGLIAAFFSVKFYKFGVFFMNAIAGFMFGLSLGGIVAALLLALVVGIVAVFLTKPCIIVTTAFTGGMGLANCITAMANIGNQWVLLMGIGICVLGVVFQFTTTRRA